LVEQALVLNLTDRMASQQGLQSWECLTTMLALHTGSKQQRQQQGPRTAVTYSSSSSSQRMCISISLVRFIAWPAVQGGLEEQHCGMCWDGLFLQQLSRSRRLLMQQVQPGTLLSPSAPWQQQLRLPAA
jgi:hypothetical protein